MWIDLRYRRPTKEDGNQFGQVLWCYSDSSVKAVSVYHEAATLVAWMPIPPYKPLPDIPDGYRLLRADEYEQEQNSKAMYLSSLNTWCHLVQPCMRYYPDTMYIVPVEKQYRPFTHEEFAPHRERWWRLKVRPRSTHPPQSYSPERYGTRLWEVAFDDLEFEDGTPFGIEVTDD